MKGTSFALITLFVGSLANPTVLLDRVLADAREERIVTGQIIQAIEDMAQQIVDAGLDPLVFDFSNSYELPVPILFSANALVENFQFTGLSNIVVESINYSLLQNRLTFNIVLPSLSLNIEGSEVDVIFFGKDYAASASGSLNINGIRIIGDIRISIGIISGIGIRSLSLQFVLGGIESNLSVRLLGNDLSSTINTFLGTTVPNTLNEFSAEINELIETIAWGVIEDVLGRSLTLV